jgi:rfaE bifunctional protein nucleotidyltransferase chain/domain
LRRSEDKLVSNNTLRERIDDLPRPLVFTNGCFDIIHRGHIDYLEQARALGNSLVVGVNSDESVRRLDKGTGRPINTVSDRAAVLAALECVDLVVVFDTDTPLPLVTTVRPDVLVKGGDWPVEKIVGAKEVQSSGGTVHSIPVRYPVSTSKLIDRIRQ